MPPRASRKGKNTAPPAEESEVPPPPAKRPRRGKAAAKAEEAEEDKVENPSAEANQHVADDTIVAETSNNAPVFSSAPEPDSLRPDGAAAARTDHQPPQPDEMKAESEGEDAAQDISEDHAVPQRAADLYLDTVNRTALDFDFEKVCSVSLSNINVYGCLVCGKYFQGRSKKSPAYAHSIHDDHHVFINLESTQVRLP